MKQAKIAELKSNLSSFLSEVRKGETVVVCDRATPIARLIPFDEEDDLTILEATHLARDAGKVKAPRFHKRVNIDRILAEMRADK